MTQPDGVSGESGASTPGEDPAEMALLLKRLAGAEGFDLAGIARPDPSAHSTFLHWWLGEGHQGQMEYLARTDALERRAHPASSMPRAGPEGADSLPGTLLVVGHSYFQADPEGVPEDPSRGVVARYARGRDYHKVVKKGLKGVHRGLEKALGRSVPARISVDTGPILERELGQRAGLGWFGRNTMLIHPRRGSYFFLGVLLLELEAEPDPPFEPDHCGTCRACLDACPTGALLGRNEGGAPVMDARRCISYLTIEHRGPIPRELRPLMGNRVYGCDICQEVCPFSRTFSTPASEPAYASRAPNELPFGVEPEPGSSSSHPGTAAPSLIELLETALDEAAWDSFSRGSAIRRAGRAGFARNVCVGLGNWGSPEAVPVLTSALSDPEPLVREHAAWALGRVGSADAKEALASRWLVESDESVRSELAAALAP